MSCVVTKNIPTFQQLGFNSKSRLCISVMSSLNSLVVADWMADHPEAVDIITWTGKTFKKYLKISVSIEIARKFHELFRRIKPFRESKSFASTNF